MAIGDGRGRCWSRFASVELCAGCTAAVLSSGVCVSSAVGQAPLVTAGAGIAVALLRPAPLQQELRMVGEGGGRDLRAGADAQPAADRGFRNPAAEDGAS